MHRRGYASWDFGPVCSCPIRDAVVMQPAPLWRASCVLDGDSAEKEAGSVVTLYSVSAAPALRLTAALWTSQASRILVKNISSSNSSLGTEPLS